MTAKCEKKGRVMRRREGIPVKTPELTERRRIIRPFFGMFRQALTSNAKKYYSPKHGGCAMFWRVILKRS